jgi:hypothetical protein
MLQFPKAQAVPRIYIFIINLQSQHVALNVGKIKKGPGIILPTPLIIF